MTPKRPVTPDNDSFIPPGATLHSVTDEILAPSLHASAGRGWWISLLGSFLLFNVLIVSILWLLIKGVGIWGINIPIGWGLAIINFVWWIGIGHAGTLISAILFLLHQDWRASISRFAEAMTLFAVACAAIFPLLHLGRPGVFYWMIPYPSTTGVWPQFRSPLMWDFFAVLTYGTVSILFWYQGIVPDLASMRDQANTRASRVAYGILALGWRNSALHWRRYKTAYTLMAALATPLVISVHTIVSFDFAVSIVPGWHSTIFPPYFVAGAIFCGFAMVIAIAVPLRTARRWRNLITIKHLDRMGKLMLAAGLGVSYGYLMDAWVAWYHNRPFDSYIYSVRFSGPYAANYWALVICNCLIPQLLWFPKLRQHPVTLYCIAIAINIGMWLERLIIISVSLHRDHLPSTWSMYYPTFWDWSLFAGTFGLFLCLLFLFVRLLPAIAIADVRELVAQTRKSNP